MTADDVEAERPGQVGDDGFRRGLDGGCDLGDRRVRCGDRQQVDAPGGVGEVVASTERRIHPPPGGGERTTQREAGPTRADHA